MTAALEHALVDLLAASFETWGVAASAKVRCDAGNTVHVAVGDAAVTIARAPAAMPFRWVIKADGRTRTAASIPGALRVVRQHISPAYQPLRVAIGPLPPVAP